MPDPVPMGQPPLTPKDDLEWKERLLVNRRGSFSRPRKISNDDKIRKVELNLSSDEYEVLRAFAEGFSVDALARAWQCHKSTITSALRDILRPGFGLEANFQKERKQGDGEHVQQ